MSGKRDDDRSFLEQLRDKLTPADAPLSPLASPDDEDEVLDLTSYLQVRVQGEHFVIPVRAIEEVIIEPSVTPVPRTRPEVMGVFLHRGALVPLAHAAPLIGVAGTAEEVGGRVRHPVVVLSRGEDALGLEVSEVKGIIDIEEPSWNDLPADQSYRYVRRSTRINGTLAGLLEVGELLSLDPTTMVEGA